MALDYLSLDISCIFTTPALLPTFKGSTLRGAFGHSLKSVSCTLRNQRCADCLLVNTCAYAIIFATEQQRLGRVAARPHPYIINPSPEQQREYDAGDVFSFNLILLGPATRFLPHIIYTVQEMGNRGLGKDARNGGGKYHISGVKHAGLEIYTSTVGVLNQPESFPRLEPDAEVGQDCEELGLHLLTPLRIKNNQSFVRKVTFSHLIRAALRRVSMLEDYYGGGEPAYDYRGLCQLAEDVQKVADDTAWLDYKRYSNRQKRDMMFGGLSGSMRFRGDLTPFIPLLRYAERVHLGKQTAFGLGRMRMEVEG